MSLAFLGRQVQLAGQGEWQQFWKACTTGSSYTTTAKRQPLWVPTWKPSKLIRTKQTTASTIHQLRLGHGYFKSYLIRLPNYNSTRCQCSEPHQTVKHLLLGCPIYSRERERVGIQRDQTVGSLLFTPRRTDIITTFLQETGVGSRGWLLQGGHENQREDCWGWGGARVGGNFPFLSPLSFSVNCTFLSFFDISIPFTFLLSSYKLRTT